MSGKKDSYHVDMAGVSVLGRKENPAGSKSARRGGTLATKHAKSRRVARSGR
jgi:hypothetical protein